MEVLFENSDYIALNKPAGMLVHIFSHQKSETSETVVDWMKARYPQITAVGDDPLYRPGVVHRLDRETSGALLMALTQDSFLYLKSLFQNKTIRKTYFAIVAGVPKSPKGTISYPIGIKSGTTKRTIHGAKNSKEAITEYEVIASREKEGELISLVRVRPLTGRTHQIRIHLNALHTPVLGDKLYGGKRNASRAPRHMLHCSCLEFTDVTGIERRICAPVPADMQEVWGEKIASLEL